MKDIYFAQAAPTTGNTLTTTKSEPTKATDKDAVPQQNPFTPLLFPILLLFVFYFLLIRPQQKKEKERKESLKKIKKGDKVLTRGGIIASIADVKDGNIIKLKIADNTFINVNVQYIDVVNPINETKNSENKKEKK